MGLIRQRYKGKITPGNPRILGVSITDTGINFAVSVPDGEEAYLLLYKRGTDEIQEIPLEVNDRVGDISAIHLQGKGIYEYNYEIAGRIVQDPYAKEIIGREEFGQELEIEEIHRIRCRIPKEIFHWGEDPHLNIPYHESILYKVHVRGYTKHTNSKVRQKGTFKGLQGKIAYFQKLGITAIELMPAYEFEEVPSVNVEALPYQCDRQKKQPLNYWGYSKGWYFAPKQSYCATKDPVNEVKEFIKYLHKAGIECIMEFFFPANTNPELAIEAIKYWKMEYHIDGFHLLGEGAPVEMIMRDPLLTRTKLLFTNVDTSGIYKDNGPAYKNIAEYNMGFQNDVRRFLKGDEDQLGTFAYRARRNPQNYGVINYMTNNDGFTLADLVSYDNKHNEENHEDNRDGTNYNYSWNCGVEGPSRKVAVRKLRSRQLKNAMLCMLLSQGTPLIYGGDEIGNSQQGNNNAYCQDNEIGWVDWSMTKRYGELSTFVEKAIAFRKAHPIFHMEQELRIMDYKSIGYPDLSYHSERAWFPKFENTSHSIGMMFCGQYAQQEDGTEDDILYVAYNGSWKTQNLALPNLPDKMLWHMAMDTKRKEGFYETGKEVLLEEQKVMEVSPRTILILIAKEPVKEKD